MVETLKPCPHCGENLVELSDHHGTWWGHRSVGSDCIHAVTQLHDAEDFRQWNRRPASVSLASEPVAELAAPADWYVWLNDNFVNEEGNISSFTLARLSRELSRRHKEAATTIQRLAEERDAAIADAKQWLDAFDNNAAAAAKAVVKTFDLEEKLTSAEADIAKLREGLKPFAGIATAIVQNHLSGHAEDDDMVQCRVGDCFAARDLLAAALLKGGA